MNTRHIVMLCAGLGASLVFLGCKPKDETPPTPTGSTGSTLDRAADSARDATNRAGDALASTWESVKDSTYDERMRFRSSLAAVSTSLDARISELQARSATASDATKESWNRGLEKLREAREDLQEELDDLGDATAANWDRAKANVASAWERVRQSYSELEAQRTSS